MNASKVVAWDVAEREKPAIAADVMSRARLRERISRGRSQPLMLHSDNGNALPQASRRVAFCHAREPSGGTRRAQGLLQTTGI